MLQISGDRFLAGILDEQYVPVCIWRISPRHVIRKTSLSVVRLPCTYNTGKGCLQYIKFSWNTNCVAIKVSLCLSTRLIHFCRGLMKEVLYTVILRIWLLYMCNPKKTTTPSSLTPLPHHNSETKRIKQFILVQIYKQFQMKMICKWNKIDCSANGTFIHTCRRKKGVSNPPPPLDASS